MENQLIKFELLIKSAFDCFNISENKPQEIQQFDNSEQITMKQNANLSLKSLGIQPNDEIMQRLIEYSSDIQQQLNSSEIVSYNAFKTVVLQEVQKNQNLIQKNYDLEHLLSNLNWKNEQKQLNAKALKELFSLIGQNNFLQKDEEFDIIAVLNENNTNITQKEFQQIFEKEFQQNDKI